MDVVRLLESHRGRDKIVRLATYACMLLSGNGTGKFHKRMEILVRELGGCRTVLRLFDDLPMLASNYMYGTGSKEKNILVRACRLITNLAYQVFFPVEHVAWLNDKGVISGFVSAKWVVGSIALWAIALMADIIRCIARISSIKTELRELKKQQILASEERNELSEDSVTIKEQRRKLIEELQETYLTLIQDGGDFMNAINWMPPGFLWAGYFSRSSSGIFGLISTTMMLIKAWPKKSNQKAA
ncbi:hypothetical protein FSP39_018194 [Pinctada imbricata]|uniref:Peroxisomal membrane protein 11C n=1 Tax=Pinctada imbricata TaxID=66713 RepID=A0AA89BTX4_PINIB|nr:hypothetical protein FSP39_018194 [Pinctada imbricata]